MGLVNGSNDTQIEYDMTRVAYSAIARVGFDKGVFVGGERGYGLSATLSSTINIATASNATQYNGILPYAVDNVKSCTNGTIILTGCEYQNNTTNLNITQTNIISESNFTIFGTLRWGRQDGSACSDGINAYFLGGTSLYEYFPQVTIDTFVFNIESNASGFASMAGSPHILGTSDSNDSYIVYGAQAIGYDAQKTYGLITHSTLSENQTWGELAIPRRGTASSNNGSDIIIWSGQSDAEGWVPVTSIEHFLFNIGGISTTFGYLTQERDLSQSCTNGIIAVLGTGIAVDSNTLVNTYESLLFATQSNTNNWGDLTIWDYQIGAGAAGAGSAPNIITDPLLDLYSYITLDKISFETDDPDTYHVGDGPNIDLFRVSSNDVDIKMTDIWTTHKIDPSVDGARSLETIDNQYIIGKPLKYNDIKSIRITNAITNCYYSSWTDEDITSSIWFITGCDVDYIDAFIWMYQDYENISNITGLIINDSIVKTLDTEVMFGYANWTEPLPT